MDPLGSYRCLQRTRRSPQGLPCMSKAHLCIVMRRSARRILAIFKTLGGHASSLFVFPASGSGGMPCVEAFKLVHSSDFWAQGFGVEVLA